MRDKMRDKTDGVVMFLTIGLALELVGGVVMAFVHSGGGFFIGFVGFLLIVASGYALWVGHT